MSEAARYCLKRQSFPVEIEGPDGQVKTYIAKEADASAGKNYRNATVGRASMEGEKWKVGESGDADTILVADCLFETVQINGEAKDRPVPIAIVRTWPDRVTSDIAYRIKEISGLLPKEDAEALRKRIAKDTEKLAKLEQDGDEAKN